MGAQEDDARQARLAAALRANLQRRKLRSREFDAQQRVQRPAEEVAQAGTVASPDASEAERRDGVEPRRDRPGMDRPGMDGAGRD